ncbi:MAG: serpin family protein [Microcystaceae cyanobacterium]
MLLQRMIAMTALLGILWQFPFVSVSSGDLSSIMGNIMEKPLNVEQAQQKLMNAHINFSFKLFTEISNERSAENLLLSPSSVAIALSLLYNGASGETQTQMGQLLGFDDMALEEVNLASQALQNALQSSDDIVQVNLANSLWVKQDVSFRHQFLKNNRQYFNAEITNLDFENPESVKIINRWVAQKTQGKIDKIIDSIEPQHILFLINAIYFKGEWQTQFDEELTNIEEFFLMDGSTQEHPLMMRSGDFLYQETDQFQAVSLPYGEGGWRFDVYLPKEDDTLPALLEQLNQDNWIQWVKDFQSRKGLLKLPRFQSEYEIGLETTLQALGMKDAFVENKADFSQMTSYPVVIDQVQHKTFIEVNEEGTEAAAVTSIGVGVTSAMPQQPIFEMIVNRPFFYAIRHEETGTILFMGTVVNPSE